MPTEADTCRTLVTPLLQSAGWDTDPHAISEQRSITDGRIVPVGQRFVRRAPLRADYLLFFRRDFPLAVVEAKAAYKSAADGLQQAKNYAERLGLHFAYATNGAEILEFDYFTGRTTRLVAYQTKDFERAVALRARTEAIARHLSNFLKATDRFAKTIVFCVDQEHASEMLTALSNENADLVRQYPDYVCRVTSDESDIGRGHLSRFQDVETRTPTILTTSQLLTTGIDAPTCKNIVLARVVGSMSEFKQIIGRGTRVRDDYGKLWFNILDYTGSATRLFADPDFDGDPARITEECLDTEGADAKTEGTELFVRESPASDESDPSYPPYSPESRRKYYFDGGCVEIAAHLVYELDPDGKQLRVVRYTEYAADKVRSLCPTSPELRARWSDPEKRSALIQRLEERGIGFEDLAAAAKQPDADPFDLLCHLAFNAPLRTRRERAQQLKQTRPDFFTKFGPEARQVLEELLEKYANTATPSSACRTCSRSRRFRSTAPSTTSSASSAGRRS
jgi:type I restriction enzyme R subunit